MMFMREPQTVTLIQINHTWGKVQLFLQRLSRNAFCNRRPAVGWSNELIIQGTPRGWIEIKAVSQ
jgi:hypothetical protein